MQNVLFVLGGLLLGTAAIAFTAVAWTTFGVAGRAAILGVVTLIALALPLVALMRKLRATAETFVAIGLLLVILDGYAAWTVNLANVQSIPSSRYTGLVLAVTAAVALTYRAFTRLVGPSFAALLTVQPVIFLVIEPAGPNAAGVSLMASAVAAVNAAVLWRLLAAERPESGKLPATRYALAGLAGSFDTVWIVTAGTVALFAEFASGSVTGRVQAGAATVVAAVVLVAGTLVARQRDLTRLAGATLVIAVAVAGGFLIVAVRPGHAIPAHLGPDRHHRGRGRGVGPGGAGGGPAGSPHRRRWSWRARSARWWRCCPSPRPRSPSATRAWPGRPR